MSLKGGIKCTFHAESAEQHEISLRGLPRKVSVNHPVVMFRSRPC